VQHAKGKGLLSVDGFTAVIASNKTLSWTRDTSQLSLHLYDYLQISVDVNDQLCRTRISSQGVKDFLLTSGIKFFPFGAKSAEPC
jgi:hypothetical protein